MCSGGKQPKATTPAPAPAPALPAPDVPEIGESRRKESQEEFGTDAPTYRVKRTTKTPSMNPDSNITM